MSFKLVSFLHVYLMYTAEGRGMLTEQRWLRWLCDGK